MLVRHSCFPFAQAAIAALITVQTERGIVLPPETYLAVLPCLQDDFEEVRIVAVRLVVYAAAVANRVGGAGQQSLVLSRWRVGAAGHINARALADVHPDYWLPSVDQRMLDNAFVNVCDRVNDASVAVRSQVLAGQTHLRAMPAKRADRGLAAYALAWWRTRRAAWWATLAASARRSWTRP